MSSGIENTAAISGNVDPMKFHPVLRAIARSRFMLLAPP
jgi:hypothetical protein